MNLHWNEAYATITQSPYLGIFITLLSFQLGLFLYKLTRQNPLAHPVLISVITICVVLMSLNIPYKQYHQSAQWLSQLLGPVIVALAIPLYENLKALKQHWIALLISNLIGGAVSVMVAMGILYLAGIDGFAFNSMWTKSITTAIAIEVAPRLGGAAALAAAVVMITGIVGAIIGPILFRIFSITHPAAQGVSLGVCAHAVGTSKAMELGSEQAAFAALSMGLMGILCAVILPMLLIF